MQHKPLFFLIGLFIFLPFLHAQDVRQYSFTHYGAAEGLISNEARAVLHDDDGFVWVGTNNGLQRYDGSRFITFKHDPENPNSIAANMVHQLLKDNERNIWVLSGDGKVSLLNPRRMVFKQVPVRFRNGNHQLATKKLVRDDKGNVFLIAANLEFITWNKESGEFKPENNPFRIPGERRPLDITYQASTGKYWIATHLGLVIYNSKSLQYSYAGNNAEQEPILFRHDSYAAYNLFIDRDQRLWYDVWGPGHPYINCFDLKKGISVLYQYEFVDIIRSYYETHGYMQQRDGSIWIRGLGVFAKFLENEKRFQLVYNGYVNEQSIVYEELSSFCEDNDNNVWLTTSNNGLYRFAPSEQYFTNVRHLHPVTRLPGKGGILSFLELPGGDILASSWGDGLFRYDSALHEKPLSLPGIPDKASPTVWDLEMSHDGKTIWMGIQPGIGKYSLPTKTYTHYDPAILTHRTVRQLEEDDAGNLWIGMQAYGVFKWDAKKGNRRFEEGIVEIKEIPKASIGSIFIDSKGFIWVASIGHGVYVIDPDTDKPVMHLPATDEEGRATSMVHVHHVMEYDDTTMVLAGGSYLNIFNRISKNIRAIGNENIISGSITSTQKDRKSGYLWASSTQGLYRVNIFNRIFVHFDRLDGISDDRFLIASNYRLSDGRMLFGADNQFTVFQPGEVRINNMAPPVSITGFRVFDRNLLVDSLLQLKRVELSPKQNSLTIDFSGLSYNGAYLIRYKLDGLDEDWRVADKSNQAVYTYLPPGNYTFMARSEDADGNMSVHVTEMAIKVYPHFWQTWWFYGLLLLFGASLLYWIDRERIRRMNELQRVRSEIANNLHADVTTTLSNINLLGEMAKIKADKDIDRSKEFIDQISAKSHNMIIAMDDILWSIDPANDSMDKTVLRMMEFTDALRNRHAANIELIVDKKVQSLKLDMMTRHEFFLIFKEGLRLIVQYAGGRNSLVQIDYFRHRLSLKLQDSTAKLDENLEEIEGLIRQINERANSLKGEADIQYDRNGIAIVVLV